MHRLSERVREHESSKTHTDGGLRFSAFGRVNICDAAGRELRASGSSSQRRGERETTHPSPPSSKVASFEEYLSSLCEAKNESEGSNNPGVFRGLWLTWWHRWMRRLRSGWAPRFSRARLRLLESVPAVIRGHITEGVRSAKFVAIQADETVFFPTVTGEKPIDGASAMGGERAGAAEGAARFRSHDVRCYASTRLNPITGQPLPTSQSLLFPPGRHRHLFYPVTKTHQHSPPDC